MRCKVEHVFAVVKGISGIFRFEIRHVRYMPIDVGTAHNHTAAVGKPSILIALISDIPNPATSDFDV